MMALTQRLISAGYGNMISLLLDVTFFGLVTGFPLCWNSTHLWMICIVKLRASSSRVVADHATPVLSVAPDGISDPTPLTMDDVAVGPCSVNILLEFSSFLAALQWPQGAADLGTFGTYYFQLLLMFEIHVGHRFVL